MFPTTPTFSNDFGAAARAFAAPAPFYIGGEDNLELSGITSATGVQLVAAGRVMGFDGVSRPFDQRIALTSNRVITTSLFALGEGFLQQLILYPASGTPANGQCWARARIVRGLGGGTTVLGVLASGCVTAAQPLQFPGSPLRGPLDGPGFIRSIAGTNPNAGVNVTETVPTGARWKMLTMSVTLVNDATVANRLMSIGIDDGTTRLYTTLAGAVQAASESVLYTIAGFGMVHVANPRAILPLPAVPIAMLAGYRFVTDVVTFQAGDNLSAPQYQVEEWLEGV